MKISGLAALALASSSAFALAAASSSALALALASSSALALALALASSSALALAAASASAFALAAASSSALAFALASSSALAAAAAASASFSVTYVSFYLNGHVLVKLLGDEQVQVVIDTHVGIRLNRMTVLLAPRGKSSHTYIQFFTCFYQFNRHIA